jgi:glucose-6-phosphate dehydrogenase assembly protein OpcA
MATTYKVLGQVNPSATTATTLYTVGSGKSAVVSTITVCNQAASAATFRIAVRVAGSTLSAEEYIAYDSTVAANDTTAFTIGITLASTDVVTVYASTANLSFNAFGSEIS